MYRRSFLYHVPINSIHVTKQDQRQRFIDTFINSVYVFDDHAVISFNYRDGTKTVSLTEIEAVGVGSSLSLFGAPSTHVTRTRDIVVKWFALLANAVHWFNPALYLLRRELARECQLAADEAVIRHIDVDA